MRLVGKSVRLSGRLLAILEMVGDCKCVADIGCDHGRLSVALLQANPERKVIATDISPHSIKKAADLRERCALSDRMEILIGDGFIHGYPQTLDCAVIAGMGGMLIADILREGMDICRRLDKIVMQPMRGINELRRFLHESGFVSVDERLVEDSGRIYQVLSFRYTGESEEFPADFPSEYYEFGYRLFENRDPLLYRALENKFNEYSGALKSLKTACGESRELEKRLLKTLEAMALLEYVCPMN